LARPSLTRFFDPLATKRVKWPTWAKISEELTPLIRPPESTREELERRIESGIQADQRLDKTERRALILARRGQGLFRANVQSINRACRVTKVARRDHLIASHIKPWCDSANDERFSSENGLLLTPTMDPLVRQGFHLVRRRRRADRLARGGRLSRCGPQLKEAEY
jgi:hypothetical protein